MATIYESQKIDYQTGEIIEGTKIAKSYSNERFLFARSTEGLEWINGFRTILDLKVFMVLVEFQEPKTGMSIFTGLQIKHCALFFGCTEKTIRNCISSLIATGFLYKIASGNYYTNPYTFYKGGVITLKEKVAVWNSLVKEDKKEEAVNSLSNN